MAKLINGNGNPAIYAAEDADLIASLAGNVTCIANVGNKYAATEEDATTIRLDDGVIITKEGRRIQLEAGESDTFYIPTGTNGQTNYYIIGYKLVQNADSTQVAEQFVQKMNSSSETITEDTFRSGATEVYVSVYRVTQVGFTIDSVDRLLPELLDSASIKEDIEQTNSDLGEMLRKDGSSIVINPVSNLNNFKTGIAMFSYAVDKNMPANDWALVVAGGEAYTNVQIASTIFGQCLYTRSCADGNWTPWKPYTKGTYLYAPQTVSGTTPIDLSAYVGRMGIAMIKANGNGYLRVSIPFVVGVEGYINARMWNSSFGEINYTLYVSAGGNVAINSVVAATDLTATSKLDVYIF